MQKIFIYHSFTIQFIGIQKTLKIFYYLIVCDSIMTLFDSKVKFVIFKMQKLGLFLLFVNLVLVNCVEDNDKQALIFVPRGENPNNSKNRVIFSLGIYFICELYKMCFWQFMSINTKFKKKIYR